MWNYETSLEWLQPEEGDVESHGKPGFRVTSPPEFGGQPGRWTPEDLLVSAVESCLMLTTLHFVKKMNISLQSYRSQATGHLKKTKEGLRFSSMDIHIDAEVQMAGDDVKMLQAVQEAEKRCPVSAALHIPVHVTLSAQITSESAPSSAVA